MILLITFVQHGDFSKTENFLKKLTKNDIVSRLKKYGELGVQALANATPRDTGKTAESWTYRIVQTSRSIKLEWLNTNTTKEGIPIVIFIQYGHVTRSGGYVQGRDFINPAIRPIFDEIARNVWKEVR